MDHRGNDETVSNLIEKWLFPRPLRVICDLREVEHTETTRGKEERRKELLKVEITFPDTPGRRVR